MLYFPFLKHFHWNKKTFKLYNEDEHGTLCSRHESFMMDGHVSVVCTLCICGIVCASVPMYVYVYLWINCSYPSQQISYFIVNLLCNLILYIHMDIFTWNQNIDFKHFKITIYILLIIATFFNKNIVSKFHRYFSLKNFSFLMSSKISFIFIYTSDIH